MNGQQAPTIKIDSVEENDEVFLSDDSQSKERFQDQLKVEIKSKGKGVKRRSSVPVLTLSLGELFN